MKILSKEKLKNESGFTYIEALIASVVLSIMTLSMAHFLGNTVSHNTKNDRRTQAVTLAEEKIEDLKSQNLATPLTNGDSSSDTPQSGIFNRTWTINTGTTPTTVTVSVGWDGVGTSQVELTTMLF